MNKIISFLKNNWKLISIVGGILIVFIIFNSVNNGYHRQEIKSLQSQIEFKEKKYNKTLDTLKIYKDSSKYYKEIAYSKDIRIYNLEAKVKIIQKEKEAVLSLLNNLSLGEIENFFNKRYYNIPKSNIKLGLDKNMGNEVVKELIEKDYITQEYSISKEINNTLKGQVDTLKTSLGYSEKALIQADTALNIRSQQLKLANDMNKLFKEDLKKAKRKSFWNTVKGIGVGLVTGITVMIVK